MSAAYALFKALDPSDTSEGSFSAAPFPAQTTHRVAVNASGDAVILVRTQPAPVGAPIVPVRTENIEVTFSAPYRVRYLSGTTQDEVFTAVTCLIADPPIVRYFFDVIGGLLQSIGPDPRIAEVDAAVRSVSQLFQALAVPGTKSVQGVWSELFLLASSRDIAVAASAWHLAPEDRYDFSMGAERLEVKSSSRRRRVHHFSLDQLNPAAGVRLWVASLFVERSAGGLTLEALLTDICERVAPDQASRIRRIASETLGASFANALELEFDRELAADSLRYYDHLSIPRVAMPVPVQLSDIHFQADLSGTDPGTPTSGLAALFPPSGAGG